MTYSLKSLQILFRDGSFAGQPDGALLDRFLGGPPEVAEAAFAVLVERHGVMVRRTCRQVTGDHHDAEDAAQATFLVLARRPRSVRATDSLAAWLHGVARRVSARANADAARRRARERRSADLAAVASPRREPWPEVHEELARLPERYRQPIVLCYLEGLSYAQAAHQLRCPIRTLQTRLARGRDRLRSRLARRGLGPAAGLLVAALAPEPTSAAWTLATARAATRSLAGGALPRVTTTTSLLEGVLKEMFMIKLLKAAAAVILIAVGVGGLGALAQTVPAPAPNDATPQALPAPAPRVAAAKPYRLATAGGGMIEVIGISRWPSGPTTAWWRPDGTPLDKASLNEFGNVTATLPEGRFQNGRVTGLGFAVDKMAFELAFRWSAPDGATLMKPIRLEIPTPAGLKESFGRSLDGFVPSLPAIQDSLPPGRETGTLRFRVASDEWTFQAKVEGRNLRGGIGLVERESGPIMFATHHGTGDRVSIVVADGVGKAVETRLVAVDRRGEAPYPSRILPAESGGVRMQEFEFDLALDAVEQYHFQTRPIEALEFKDIALAPSPPSRRPGPTSRETGLDP